ncbi:Mbov_0401 family ICE element transposase-like protein [Mycoplasma sp. 4404]|uniref:Mbov_0401 family ICE element transposase-like protein n=1 Tax=Mycoplasma sp. 4404 TaxID=3108530 RepID=UPI002B1E1ADB|nr:hypothetical protein [Mycoplasma sp. 4404]MEA4162630.1 hypothetical protein [Mycoplasma sp. 4404]
MKSGLILNLLKKNIERADFEYKISSERKQNKWFVHSKVRRKLITEFGILEVFITKYYKFVNGKKIVSQFENDYLRENKRQRVSIQLKEKIVNQYLREFSAKNIVEYFKNTFSKGSVFLTIKKLRNQIKPVIHKELAKDKEVVYINADDSFLKTRIQKRTIETQNIRSIMLHLGKDENSKILGKHSILEITPAIGKKNAKKDMKSWSIYIKDKIKEVYGKDNMKILVSGDGAKWIKSLAQHLNADYIIDHYHLMKKGYETLFCNTKTYKRNLDELRPIEKILNINFYKTYKQYTDKFELDKSLELVKQIQKYNHLLSERKQKELRSLAIYLKNNSIATNKDNKYYIGSHAETWISHVVKRYTTRKFTIFSIDTLKKIWLFNSNENLSFGFIDEEPDEKFIEKIETN